MDFFDLTPGHGGFGGGILERNLRAIERLSPRTADAVRGALPRTDVTFVETPEGVLSASILEEAEGDLGPAITEADPLGLGLDGGLDGGLGFDGGVGAGGSGGGAGKTRWLASKRRPLAEAANLAGTVDLTANGGVCVLGFGLGYHCRVLGERLGDKGVVVCYEPDVGLLRAVLEKVDHAGWIESGHFLLLTDPDDRPSLATGLKGVEGIVTLGAKILEHPASVKRLGEGGARFAQRFAEVLRATRTTIVTTLVQSEVTLRNMLMNLDRYATGRGVSELTGAAAGRPAIVVSAGPSLSRNIAELAKPGVREKFVIIATQTTLKPLLRAGVKPHFVTALDYHEISRRFYEGLTERDVRGVTLVAEAKANPVILDGFPGAVRCPSDERMQMLLGTGLPASPGMLPSGGTVAHLAYYLARHLGCDPVVLVGQDLGFTDGQYYAAGAAIHDVWAGELGAFRTLEMFEWERIMREKSLLHRREDVFGRPIYSDEQMTTYLQQFEVEFASDVRAGRRVIDATEGGVAKRGAVPMALAEVVDLFGMGPDVSLPEADEPLYDPARRIPALIEHLGTVRRDAAQVAELSLEAGAALREMQTHQYDQYRVNKLITRVYELRDEVRKLEPAYGLVQFLNQTGALNRYREDRAIDLAGELDEIERQKRQIGRDIRNVEWLAQAGEVLAGLLGDAIGVLEGTRAKTTRDSIPEEEQRADPTAEAEATLVAGEGPRRAGVVLMGELDRGGLGLKRDLGARLPNGLTVLETTLRRVLRAERAAEVVVATPDPERARALAGGAGRDGRVAFVAVDAGVLRARVDGVAGARRWQPASWRGGIASVSAYDESVDLGLLERVLVERGLTDAVIVGLDWALVDPRIIDQTIELSRGRAEGKRLAVCQAVPGLGALLIDRKSVASLAGATARARSLASLGAILGYIPIAPVADPIAKSFCVPVPIGVRDLGRRVIADTPEGLGLVSGAVARLGAGWLEADAGAIAEAIEGVVAGAVGVEDAGPRHVTLELNTGRLASGLWAHWLRGTALGEESPERAAIDLSLALRVVEQVAGERPDAVLTLHGLGDPLLHPAALEIVRAAKEAGVAGVHLRTDLLREDFDAGALVSAGADVISVDVLAVEATTYAALTGHDLYQRTHERVVELVEARGIVGGMPSPWIVPRITRCDEVYGQIEPFYDGWTMVTGAAAIDPLPSGAGGEVGEGYLKAKRRIRALPLPLAARARAEREEMSIRCDGVVVGPRGERVGDVRTQGVDGVWRRLVRSRARAAEPALVGVIGEKAGVSV